MKQLQRYFSSIFLFAMVTSVAWGQNNDSVSVRESWWQIDYDYGKSMSSLIEDQLKVEFGISYTNREHLVIRGEFGYGSLTPNNAVLNGSYTSEGNYAKMGALYKITVAPLRYLSFGALYAYSTFDDHGEVVIQSELFPDLIETFERTGLTAQSAEILVTTEGPIFKATEGLWSHFYWGAHFRIRFLLSKSNVEELQIFAIPGFGRTNNTVVPAVNLFLSYRIKL